MNDRQTILIVDDNEFVRRSLALLLECSGFRVLVAANGETAVVMLKDSSNAIDCAMIDLSMPEVSGGQVAASLRSIDSNLPVLIMSAYPKDSVTRTLVDVGADGSLQKPFDRDQLLGILSGLFESAPAAV